MWGIPSNRVRYDDAPPTDWAATAMRYGDFPGYPNDCGVPLRPAAAAKGCRVMMTGRGGDEWFGLGLERCADLLRDVRLIALLRQLRSYRQIPWYTNPIRKA